MMALRTAFISSRRVVDAEPRVEGSVMVMHLWWAESREVTLSQREAMCQAPGTKMRVGLEAMIKTSMTYMKEE